MANIRDFGNGGFITGSVQTPQIKISKAPFSSIKRNKSILPSGTIIPSLFSSELFITIQILSTMCSSECHGLSEIYSN
ncbi:hypothetical protein D3C73_530500 [compost metagenome]